MKTMLAPAFLAASLLVAGPASTAPVLAVDDSAAPDGPRVVVTTQVLGSVVEQVAGDVADVKVLMHGDVDPHSWQPSARDSEAVFGADLIVANGLDLENGLVAVLEQAEAEGIPVFHAADHVSLRGSAGAEDEDHGTVDHPADEDHAAQDEEHGAGADGTDHAADEDLEVRDVDHGHGSHAHGRAAGDPHFWLDPIAMRDVVLALGPVLSDAGLDVGDRAETLAAELESLDAELTLILSVVPVEQRQLVTGHGALGYLAGRYGFVIVGTVVPGLSSADEPSARELAELINKIRAVGTTAIFTDVGTPAAVAQAVADEAGARVVELEVAQLPEGGTYQDLLRVLAGRVAEALSGSGESQ